MVSNQPDGTGDFIFDNKDLGEIISDVRAPDLQDLISPLTALGIVPRVSVFIQNAQDIEPHIKATALFILINNGDIAINPVFIITGKIGKDPFSDNHGPVLLDIDIGGN